MIRTVEVGDSFERFREIARQLLAGDIRPDTVELDDGSGAQGSLDAFLVPTRGLPDDPGSLTAAPRVPREFLALAQTVSCHREPKRWSLLYEALFRLTHGERNLLEDAAAPLTRTLTLMRRAVERDVHHVHAFVRFREVTDAQGTRFVAWYRPEHRVLPLAAPHFVRRFAAMRWSILTPETSAHWDGESLSWGPGVPRSEAPADDALEPLWRAYYASVFNPARVNPKLLRAHLPLAHWATLPEASAIPALLHDAKARTQGFIAGPPPSESSALIPPNVSLAHVAAKARDCRLCPFADHATQTVFGEGPRDATLMLVGEQPGDQEDVRGRPFVGPAGQLLDALLAEVGLPREQLYVTNAVKHFKYTLQGKRRIHEKPNAREVQACQGWLLEEVRQVRPRIILALGATAGQAFLGPSFRLVRSRGRFFETPWTPLWMATYHPSALLRMTGDARTTAEHAFRQDLAAIAERWRALRGDGARAPSDAVHV